MSGERLEVENAWVLNESECRKVSSRSSNKENSKWRAWTRNADEHESMAGQGAEFLNATPFRDCSALTLKPVWCGEGSFPSGGLPAKAFIMACGCSWKITKNFWPWAETLEHTIQGQTEPCHLVLSLTRHETLSKLFNNSMHEFFYLLNGNTLGKGSILIYFIYRKNIRHIVL